MNRLAALRATESKVSMLVVIVCTAMPLCKQATAVSIETVPVGNAWNLPDTELMRDGTTGYGAVSYEFRIGKYEVTLGQYAEFLNAVAVADRYLLYSLTLASTTGNGGGILRSGVSGSYSYTVFGSPNRPITYVDWGDVARFANWMHNGQPRGPQNSSTTEDGAYTLNGATSIFALNAVTRNSGARWFIPSENEWYKAAYHKNDGVTANYWDYPTSSDFTPYSDQPPGTESPNPSNTANFYRDDLIANGYNDGYAVAGSPSYEFVNYLTDVGAYTSAPSPYGTFDQGGNLWEWNEGIVPANDGRSDPLPETCSREYERIQPAE